jgi:LacI family transcriptional regulator, kdg operon repressor
VNKVNIAEVALKAGVSKASVSNYLNNKEGKLSEPTRNKIHKVIKELDYTPYLGARRLSLKSTSKTIGIVLENTPFDNLTDMNFFLHLSRYISEELRQEGYRFIIIPDQNLKSENMLEYIKSLTYGLIDGFLLLNIQEKDKYILEFKKMGIPFVCFGHTQLPDVLTYVATDHGGGIQKACNYFFAQDISEIFISVASRSEVVTQQYLDGYMAAMKEHNQPVAQTHILGRNVPEDVNLFNAFKTVLETAGQPSGFIIHALQQYELLHAINETGKTLNKDVVYILHDYFPQFVQDKQITYLRSPMEELGRSATKMLMRLIKNKDSAEAPAIFNLPLEEGKSGLLIK